MQLGRSLVMLRELSMCQCQPVTLSLVMLGYSMLHGETTQTSAEHASLYGTPASTFQFLRRGGRAIFLRRFATQICGKGTHQPECQTSLGGRGSATTTRHGAQHMRRFGAPIFAISNQKVITAWLLKTISLPSWVVQFHNCLSFGQFCVGPCTQRLLHGPMMASNPMDGSSCFLTES